MKLTIDYDYTQRFIPTKRHRKIRTRTVSASVELEIAEVSEANFPVALITHDRELRFSESEGSSMVSVACPYRYFNKSFWCHLLRIKHLAQKTGYFNLEDLKNYLTPSAGWSGSDESVEFEEGKSIAVSDNKQAKLNDLKNQAAKFIVFNGEVWEKRPEPLYSFTTFGIGYNDGTLFQITSFTPGYEPAFYFNALQRDEAIQKAKEVATRRHDTRDAATIGDDCNIEVLMPETIKWMRAIPQLKLGNFVCNSYSLTNLVVSFMDEGKGEPVPYLEYVPIDFNNKSETLITTPVIKIKLDITNKFGLEVDSFEYSGEKLREAVKKIGAYHGFVEALNKKIAQHIARYTDDEQIDETETKVLQEEF